MSDERIADLEIRYSHQEASLEALTRTVVEQQQLIDLLSRQLEQMRAMMRELAASAGAVGSGDEPPPPHY